jgi:transcriptional regulator with XRE-family HTH domain
MEAEKIRRTHPYMTPKRIKAIRESLGFSQQEAGILIGGGTAAFSKYERGVMAPMRPMLHFLLLLELLGGRQGAALLRESQRHIKAPSKMTAAQRHQLLSGGQTSPALNGATT